MLKKKRPTHIDSKKFLQCLSQELFYLSTWWPLVRLATLFDSFSKTCFLWELFFVSVVDKVVLGVVFSEILGVWPPLKRLKIPKTYNTIIMLRLFILFHLVNVHCFHRQVLWGGITWEAVQANLLIIILWQWGGKH